MMRRGAARWAAAATSGGGSHTIQAVLSPRDGDEALATPLKAPYSHVRTESLPESSFIPTAAEAPERLQIYVEPKPFIHPRRLQVFTVSLGVGAASVALVYFFLSKRISNYVEEEQLQLTHVKETNRLAMLGCDEAVPNFTAPSSYDELYAKMVEKDREMAVELAQAKRTLHTEMIFHLKMWWNRCLRNVQSATDAVLVARARRKEAQVEVAIKDAVQYHGYTATRLSKVDR